MTLPGDGDAKTSWWLAEVKGTPKTGLCIIRLLRKISRIMRMSENEALGGVGSRMVRSGSDGKAAAKLRSPMSGEQRQRREAQPLSLGVEFFPGINTDSRYYDGNITEVAGISF